MGIRTCFGCALAAAVVSSPALAATQTIKLNIRNTTVFRDNFGFSVFHTADTAQNQGGVELGRFDGHIKVAFDDVANTLTFKDFQGDIGQDGSVDVTLLSETTLSIDGGNLVAGSLHLNVDGADSTFNFQAIAFNDFANRWFEGGVPTPWDSDPFGLGLWGLSSNPNDAFGHSGDVGIDIFASGAIVPLPTATALAGLGLVGVVARRRR